MNAIETNWQRIEAFLEEAGCGQTELRGPAGAEDLAALEGSLDGWELPAAFTASVQRHDGFGGVVLGYTFPAVAALKELHERLCASPEWDSCWLAVGSSEAGDYLCLDLETNEVFEHDHEEGPASFADTFEELLSWLAHALHRDKPSRNGAGELIDQGGTPWEVAPGDDEEGWDDATCSRYAWSQRAEEDDPKAYELFKKVFHAPPGPGFNRVRAALEPTRLDWARLQLWGERNDQLAARIDGLHGAVQAGSFFPSAEAVEEELEVEPGDLFWRYARALLRFFDGDYAGAYEDADAALQGGDSFGARSLRGLAGAALDKPTAKDDLRQVLAQGDWMTGHDAHQAPLAALDG